MASLTIKMFYAMELSSKELYLVLKALRCAENECPGPEASEMRDLGRKLEEQKEAFQKQMLEQMKKGGV